MAELLKIDNLSKTYAGGYQALKNIQLQINEGEIFALLGPNGAGKTTLISSICGVARTDPGRIFVKGYDIVRDYRKARALIGLVPQELTTDAFETVWNTVTFSRGLFGLAKNPDHIEKVLKSLSLWEKKDNQIMSLSGGMKRRVLIAKALSHEPKVLFLDEPTAGVDVSLRKSMLEQILELRKSGVTVVLTTHYIEEAQHLADRVGVINNGRLILVEDKVVLMKKLGLKQLSIKLKRALDVVPERLRTFNLQLTESNTLLKYSYDLANSDNGISSLISELSAAGIGINDLNTHETSLEEIFLNLVSSKEAP